MKKSILVYALVLLGIFPKLIFAQEDFSADYNITYDIDTTGVTTVTNIISITNQKEDVIATTYTLSLSHLDVFDISAFDSNGSLEIAKKSIGDATNLEVKFNTFIIGEGKKNDITIKYKTKLVANKIGDVWNVTIPKSSSPSTSSYRINLTVPKELGPKIFMSPTPIKETVEQGRTIYTFEENNLSDQNISAAFGQFQTLNFRLTYQLDNPNYFSSNYEIALPPTIQKMQRITYTSLQPKPTKTYIDKDGNYMAIYRLKSKSSIDVILTGSAQIISTQIDIAKSGNLSDIPKGLINTYTKPQPFWETESQSVKDISQKLFDPNRNTAQNAFTIYKYLTENYSYDFEIARKDFVDRYGAEKALNNKDNWGCMEFTDSFIALARAMGIPAREINGYAITASDNLHPISVELKNGDLLHAWPEFYDPYYGWVQIDPTWGNTSGTDYFSKLDTNHFALVIKGVASDYPLPAGTYRRSDNQKLVAVDFSQVSNSNVKQDSIKIRKTINLNIIKLIQGYQRYELINMGNLVLFDTSKKPILPGHKTVIYSPKNDSKISVFDALDNAYSMTKL